MRNFFTILIMTSYFSFGGYIVASEYGRSCSPKGKCTACKNCTGCKNCAKNGGTCSICK